MLKVKVVNVPIVVRTTAIMPETTGEFRIVPTNPPGR